MGDFLQIDWSFLANIGTNPFLAMWYIFLYGGWIPVLYAIGWGAIHLWLDWRQGIFHKTFRYILLSVQIPKMHEQGPRAMENAFAYLAGMHSSNSWVETWIDGRIQNVFSCEIISVEGQVQFLIYTLDRMRDITEAAIYSQYPDAEIREVEDYTHHAPHHYPDEEWDLWGTEMIPVKSDVYPLRTYPMFEDKVSGEFKDPLAALLEGFSRLGPTEQAWYQIVILPIDQRAFVKSAEGVVKKLKGEKEEVHKGVLDYIADAPIALLKMIVSGILGSGEGEHKKEGPPPNRVMNMTPGEREVIEAVENKASKIVFLCKIRFLYLAKKQYLVKSHAVHPFIGAIKQFNTNHMQSLKPEGKHVGVSGTLLWMKARRNNKRKNHLMHAYAHRSAHDGMPLFHMSIEELASLWHFPHSLQVKSPQMKKTQAKHSEPPANVPFAP
jgi:hypothetical protein